MRNDSRLISTLQLLGVMASVGAGFFLVLKVGFVLHRDPQPAPLDSPLLTALAILIALATITVVVALATRALRRAVTRSRARREGRQAASDYAEERRRRVAELAADPARARYAPLVERGESWSDAQIAYYEDVAAITTCPHLWAIERGLRAAGIETRLLNPGSADAKCRINFPALQAVYGLPSSVRYAEFYQGDRDSYDFPTAFLTCDEHRSFLHTVHPEKAGSKDVPWFPHSVDV